MKLRIILQIKWIDLGFDVHRGFGGTGVVSILRNGPGKTIMVRADMDGSACFGDNGSELSLVR